MSPFLALTVLEQITQVSVSPPVKHSLAHSKHSINVNVVPSGVDGESNNANVTRQLVWCFHLREKSNFMSENHYMFIRFLTFLSIVKCPIQEMLN